MLSNLFLEISRRNGLLARSGISCIGVGIFLLFVPLIDPRELLGAQVWTKPAKFFLSVAIYFWTMGWLMDYLEDKKFVRRISWGIWILMVVELLIITYQASLGKLSHFNLSSIFDGILFQLMGAAIVLNSILVFFVLLKFRMVTSLPSGFIMGIKVGLLIFLIASLEGFLMVGQLKHTVGAADGQEGLPFLGWAKAYGDLRVFHFFGLHALQVVPVAAWSFFQNDSRKALFFGILYFFLSFGTLWLALQGKGILAWF